MSMDEAPPTGGLEPGADPAPVGTTETEGTAEITDPAPERQFVEVDDPDNRYVRVKVAGEDREIPFSEAVRGYSRTEDYTQKTQEAARLREEAAYGLRIQQAMQRDPELALQILAREHGIQLPGQPAQQAPVEQVPEFDDPLERQLYEERTARQKLEERLDQQELDRQLERSIGGLKSTFNIGDDDVTEVLQIAYQHNLGVETFPMIWKQVAYDRLVQRWNAEQAAKAAGERTTVDRQTAAAAASQVVSSGTHGGNGLTNEVDVSQQHMTPRQAIELAFDSLGL